VAQKWGRAKWRIREEAKEINRIFCARFASMENENKGEEVGIK